MGMKENRYAGEFRDLIERMVKSIVKAERPEERLGMVYSFDANTQYALVLFPGETIENLVKVRCAKDKIPTTLMATAFPLLGYDAPGDIVRVAGKPGGYYVADYYTGAPASSGPLLGGEPAITPGTVDQFWSGFKVWRNHESVKLSYRDFVKQVVSPGTPAAGNGRLYADGSGLPRWITEDGASRVLITPIEAVHTNPGLEGVWVDSYTFGAVLVGKAPPGFHYGWCSAGVTAAQVASLTEGFSALQMNKPAGTGYNSRIHTDNEFACQPNDIVTFELDHQGVTVGGTMSIQMVTNTLPGIADFFQAGTQVASKTVSYTTSLKRTKVQFTVPAGHNTGRFSIIFDTTGNAAGGLKIDNTASSVTTPATSGVITGEIKMWPFATIPSGYLALDGTTKNVDDYPALGSLFGGAPGGTFTLPDMRGRVPVGAGTVTGLLGNEGEANEALRNLNHQHTTPNHFHNTPNHQHTIPNTGHSGGTTTTGTGANRVGAIDGTNNGNHNHGGLTGNNGASVTDTSGGSVTGANNTPREGLHFIIKT